MIIYYQALSATLQKKNHAIYILSGQEHYLLQDAASQIKAHHRQQGEWDEKILPVQQANDWSLFLDEANSYSLFADQVLLDVRYDKKTMDATGKVALKQYAQDVNNRCIVILRAPLLSAKALSWLTTQDTVLLIQLFPLNTEALQQWIHTQLKARGLQYTAEVPSLIQQHTQGNMLACAQAIERLALVHSNDQVINASAALEQLSDQCDYQLYELADACLLGNATKAIHLLRQAYQQRTEPTLILWLLTQEIRQLSLLLHFATKAQEIPAACTSLKIWPSRIKLYQAAFKRFTKNQLYTALQQCRVLDERIKSNANTTVWNDIEQLSLFLCH
jgi:DNA polymerase-3 subunit delta